MAILKSEIVGKSLLDLSYLIKDISGSNKPHGEWKALPTKHFDFIAKCTLRYATSYGASYKIYPNREFTIKHTTNGKSYPLESYGKLFNMIITDYDDSTQSSQEQPMYLDCEPIVGDYVECIRSYDVIMYEGSVWKVTGISDDGLILDNRIGYWTAANFKVINPEYQYHPEYKEQSVPTQPQPGTHWERLQYFTADSPKGEIITINSVSSATVGWYGPLEYVTRPITRFKELFKPRPDLDTPSSEPTKDNTIKPKLKVGDTIGYNEEYCNASNYSSPDRTRYKVIGTVTSIKERDSGRNPLVSYKTPSGSTDTVDEGWIEILPSPSTKTIKPKPVAQPKPIIPTPTKETFMSKIKASASATVDQNKQALVIASKMEAGRIINKQVLKQLAPHLPFFLQGYAKSPFAPFVAANLVAMVANHTGNSKLTKVSDLMLLGAADSGVAAFNLDKIVDDILSDIKLPAGVLDDSDEK